MPGGCEPRHRISPEHWGIRDRQNRQPKTLGMSRIPAGKEDVRVYQRLRSTSEAGPRGCVSVGALGEDAYSERKKITAIGNPASPIRVLTAHGS